MKTLKIYAAALFAASQFVGASAIAGGGQEQKPESMADLIVIKVPKDKVQQQQQKGSQVLPIHLEEIPTNNQGEVLWNEVAQRVHQKEQSVEAIPLKKNNLGQQDVPEAVQEEFDRAAQGSTPPSSWWRYYYNYRYGGYYGYSLYPYYGYYGNYYPTYGYYYNNALYPYYYSNYSYPYGRYNYSYWYRW